MNAIWIYFLFATYFGLVSTTYYIRNGHVPSYMYRKFNYNGDDIFPHDLRINISLSRIEGTLVYSIDKHMNQLILSLTDVVSPALMVEFRKQTFYISLNELCNCNRCRYEALDLRIQMRSTIHLQCNGGKIKTIEYDNTEGVNTDYPVPYIKRDKDISGTNEAHLWLVNTQQYGRVYPNNKQFTGCIFNIWHNGQPLIFSNITDNIGRHCRETCSKDVCNGGICYETYNRYPMCNCTKTYLNGRFCNDSLGSTNIETVSTDLIFDVFKVSWKSSVDRIMLLKNSYVQLQLYRRKSVILFQYHQGCCIRVKSIFPGNYVENSESIFIAWFREKVIETHYYNNGSWQTVLVPTNFDLSREIFTSLTLISAGGIMDFVYKTSSVDYHWNRVHVVDYKIIDFGALPDTPIHSNEYNVSAQNETLKQPYLTQQLLETLTGHLATVAITAISTLILISLILEGGGLVIGCSKISDSCFSLASLNKSSDELEINELLILQV